MSTEKMREEFEAWVDRKGLRRTCSGDYHAQGIHLYWLIWQASRAAIEVELPEFVGYQEHIVRELQAAFKASVEAASLKVKP